MHLVWGVPGNRSRHRTCRRRNNKEVPNQVLVKRISSLTNYAESEGGLALSVGVSGGAKVEARVLGGRRQDQHLGRAVLHSVLFLHLDPSNNKKTRINNNWMMRQHSGYQLICGGDIREMGGFLFLA